VYRAPSRRAKRCEVKKPNLIPILDAVFIFIFFLLMSANFIKIYEIPSAVPILNAGTPPRNEKPPLALTLRIGQDSIVVMTGVPSRTRTTIGKTADGTYDLEKLRSYLIDLKTGNMDERTVILEPLINLTYEEIVQIMDTARLIRKTDPALFKKDDAGIDVRVTELFDNIVFGNI
jgi:biopolymer transport protein ExbD